MTTHVTGSDTSTTIAAHTAGDTWIVKSGVYVTTSSWCVDASDSAGSKAFYIDGKLFSENYYGMFLGVTPDGTGGNNAVYTTKANGKSFTLFGGSADNENGAARQFEGTGRAPGRWSSTSRPRHTRPASNCYPDL